MFHSHKEHFILLPVCFQHAWVQFVFDSFLFDIYEDTKEFVFFPFFLRVLLLFLFYFTAKTVWKGLEGRFLISDTNMYPSKCGVMSMPTINCKQGRAELILPVLSFDWMQTTFCNSNMYTFSTALCFRNVFLHFHFANVVLRIVYKMLVPSVCHGCTFTRAHTYKTWQQR